MDNENLFDFWRQQKVVCPALYGVTRDIFIVPTRNTATKRLLSANSCTVTEA